MMKLLFITTCLAFCLNAFSEMEGKQVYEYDFSQPLVWTSWKSANTSGKFLWNPDEGHDKKGAMEIAIVEGHNSGGNFCYLKHFSAVPGEKYTAVVWIKAEDIAPTSEIVLAFQAKDSNKKFLDTPVVSTIVLGSEFVNGWKQIILNFVVPTENKWNKTAFLLCTVGINKASKGRVFIDDFYFVRRQPVSNAEGGDYKCDFSHPDIFSSWKSSTAVGAFSWNKNEGHNAGGSLEITIHEGSAADSVFCYLKRFPVVPGKTYTVSVWIKAENVSPSSEIILGFQGQGIDKKFLDTPYIFNTITGADIGNDWKERILTLVIPENGKWSKVVYLLCTIGIKKSFKGKIFLDDFDFHEDSGL